MFRLIAYILSFASQIATTIKASLSSLRDISLSSSPHISVVRLSFGLSPQNFGKLASF